MSKEAGWTQRLGAISCSAFVIAASLYISLISTTDYHPGWIFALFGAAVVGLLSGVAGLLSSRGQGRLSVTSVVGCAMNLPAFILALLLFTVMFGHKS